MRSHGFFLFEVFRAVKREALTCGSGNFMTFTFKTGPAAVYSQLFKIWEDETKPMLRFPGISSVAHSASASHKRHRRYG